MAAPTRKTLHRLARLLADRALRIPIEARTNWRRPQ
jgi:hypothetical protein